MARAPGHRAARPGPRRAGPGALRERFGELSPIHTDHHSASNKAVMYIGNRKKDGRIVGALPLGEMQFHTDQCYQERPAMGTMLYSIEIPAVGGNTLFANGYKAFDALPADLRKNVEILKAVNVYDYGGGVLDRKFMVKPEEGMAYAHPLARTHPATGRKSLCVNRLMTHHIEGLPAEESERCTLHARRDFDPSENRWMRRVTIKGEKPR